MINFLTFSQEWKYCTSKKYVNKNFKTGVRRLLASIFCHDIVTRVTPSIIVPFFPPRRRDRISRNRYLRKLRTGRRWFNRAARSRRVRLACETEALNDSGHLSYKRSRPPLLRFHRSSTGIVHPIDRVIERDISATTPTPGPSCEPTFSSIFLCFLQFASPDCETIGTGFESI